MWAGEVGQSLQVHISIYGAFSLMKRVGFLFGIDFHLCGIEDWSFWFSRQGKGFLVAILAKGSNTDWTTYHKAQLWKSLIFTLVIDMIGQLRRDVICRLSVKP